MRFILGLIGAAFALALTCSLFSGLKTYLTSPPAPLAAEEFHKGPKELRLPSDGPFGKNRPSCSAACKSTPRSARAAIASSWSRSAT